MKNNISLVTRTLALTAVFAFTSVIFASAYARAESNPPVISQVDNIGPVEANSASGAVVTYDLPTATDDVDAGIVVTCEPVSGSTFPLGQTTVTCNASDSDGNSAIPVSFIVTVQDTLPVITINPYNTNPTNQDIVVTATTNEGTLNEGSHTFTENGSFTFTATDSTGNQSSETVKITNIDKVSPTITAPEDITEEATGPSTPVDLGIPQISDGDNPTPPSITRNPDISEFTVGTHTITWTVIDEAGNTESDQQIVTITDTTAPTVTVNPATVDVEYGYAYVDTGVTSYDLVDGNIPCPSAKCYSNVESLDTKILGPYTVHYTTMDAKGHMSTGSRIINVVPRQITVTADDQDIVYGDPEPALTYNITHGSLVAGDDFEGALSRDSGNNVGTFAINRGSLSLSTNYALTYVGAALTITQKTLTVVANATNREYDGTADASVTLTIEGVLPDDVGNVSIADGYIASFSDKNVGDDKIVTVSGIHLTGADAGNYSVAETVQGTANITPRPLTVTATGQNKVYDGTMTAEVNWTTDALAGDTVTASGNAEFADKDVGTGKTVTVSGIVLSGADRDNYSIVNNTASAMADITARPITVTADSFTKQYEDGDPTFTYQLTEGSLAGGETLGDILTGSLQRTGGTVPGEYAIGQGDLQVNSNYSLTFVDGVLTIVDEVKPVINGTPVDFSVEASPSGNTTVSYTMPTVTDNVDADIQAVCTPDSGSVFEVGDTTVTCTAVDSSGNEAVLTTFVVTVIDSTPPNATVTYDIETPTNQSVTATITPSEDITVTNPADGSLSYTFDQDGEFVFEFADKAGNIGHATATVSWIDKVLPTITIGGYDDTTPTSGDITVTASTDEGTLNEESHTFTENGSFTFTATDAVGNQSSEIVTITNIDKVAPVVTINSLLTNDTMPTITGTVADALVVGDTPIKVTVTVNGIIYDATVAGDGTWSAEVSDVLADGEYVIGATAEDSAVNIGNASANLTIDTVKPTIVSFTPSTGALNISPTAPVTITFSEPVNVANDNIVFSPAFAGFSIAVSGVNSVIVTPNPAMAGNTHYSIALSGITDAAGNVIDDHNEINFTTLTDYSINIFGSEGDRWNLVSLPVNPINTSVNAVLGDVADNIRSVWTYDPSNPNAVGGWLSYVPSDPIETNNLTSMQSGYGYWINANTNATISGSGALLYAGPQLPASRTLSSGWNLIGYYQLPAETGSTPAAAFKSLGSDYTALWGYRNDGSSFTSVDLNTTINPGEAFWISLPAGGKIYTPSTI